MAAPTERLPRWTIWPRGAFVGTSVLALLAVLLVVFWLTTKLAAVLLVKLGGLRAGLFYRSVVWALVALGLTVIVVLAWKLLPRRKGKQSQTWALALPTVALFSLPAVVVVPLQLEQDLFGGGVAASMLLVCFAEISLLLLALVFSLLPRLAASIFRHTRRYPELAGCFAVFLPMLTIGALQEVSETVPPEVKTTSGLAYTLDEMTTVEDAVEAGREALETLARYELRQSPGRAEKKEVAAQSLTPASHAEIGVPVDVDVEHILHGEVDQLGRLRGAHWLGSDRFVAHSLSSADESGISSGCACVIGAPRSSCKFSTFFPTKFNAREVAELAALAAVQCARERGGVEGDCEVSTGRGFDVVVYLRQQHAWASLAARTVFPKRRGKNRWLQCDREPTH